LFVVIFWPGGLHFLLGLKETVVTVCRDHPVALFAALAVLPAFGFPASPLLILAGVVWGSNWQSCLIAILAMAINMTWSYFLAVGSANGIVRRLLGERWDRWKNVHPSDLIRFTAILRITPGIPFFLQNYVLGLMSVPFLPYILISVPLNGIFVVGFVLTGGAIFEGNIGLAITGIGIIALATLVIHLVRKNPQIQDPSPSHHP